jgi:hypothetical protein
MATIKNPNQLHSLIAFFVSTIRHNRGLDLPFDSWKTFVTYVLACPFR